MPELSDADVEPVLTVRAPDAPVRALALVLHGGRSRSHARVRANQLAVLRMRPFASALQRAGASHGLAVALLRYRVRGWNGSEQSPVHDAAWALGVLGDRFPDVPFALVGHSMGGRTAVYAAGHPAVRSVVGLAPWIEPGDPVEPLAGRRLLVVHGNRDRMTSAPESARFTRDAAAVAESSAYVTLRGEKHAMLGRAALWHDLAAGFVAATLCGVPPEGTVDPVTANVLTKVLAENTSVEV